MFNKIKLFSNIKLIFLLSFFVGQCTFILKLVSISKIINDISLNYYPQLMLTQGLLFFLILNILKKISGQNNILFYVMSSFLSMITILFTYKQDSLALFGLNSSILISCIIFYISSILIVALDISFKSISSTKISLLKDPKSLGKILLFHEVGSITCAIMSNYIVKFNELLLLIPFFIILILFIYLSLTTSKNPTPILKDFEPKMKLSFKLPFLKLFLSLFIITFILKQIQGFAVLLGVIKIKTIYQLDLVTIFSTISVIQTSIILLLLMKSVVKKNTSTQWSNGFNFYLLIQSFSMIFIALFNSPFAFIITGGIRKVYHKGISNRSDQLLFESVPYKYRFSIRNLTQKLGQFIAFFILGILSYLYIYNYISDIIIWPTASLLAIWGLYIRKNLLISLNKFHVKNLLNFKNSTTKDIPDLVNSCYALANKEASTNYLTMLMIITQNPPVTLKKAIIFSLGEMQEEKAQKLLIKMYKKESREDIQLSIINALFHFDNIENENFFAECINEIILNTTEDEIVKISIIRSFIIKIPFFVKEKLLTLLASEKLLEHQLNNIIGLLGELSRIKKSINLDIYLEKYKQNNYSHSIRTSAFVALYRNKNYDLYFKSYALELKKLTNDRHISHLFCKLINQTKYEEYFEDTKEILINLVNPTPSELITILRSKIEKSSFIFSNTLQTMCQEKQILTLSYFAHISDNLIRYNVYDHIINHAPKYLDQFINTLIATGREFDDDLTKIRKEALRLGISITENKIKTVDY